MLIADPLYLLQIYLPSKFIKIASEKCDNGQFSLAFYFTANKLVCIGSSMELFDILSKENILVPRKNWPAENENPSLDHDDNADFNLLLSRH